MIGIQATADSVNAAAGGAYVRLQNAMIDVHDFRQQLHGMADADLVALGFTSGDELALKAAYEDLFVLYQIWHGLASGDARQGTVYDFRQLATALTGGQLRQ